MGELKLRPIPFKSLPSPFLRLMPTLFQYTRMAGADEEVCPEVVQEADCHLEALRTFLVAAAEGTGLPRRSVRPLRNLCSTMTSVRGSKLVGAFTELIEGLQAFYQEHRAPMRTAISGDPDLYRQLYREEVRPKNILAVFNEGTWAQSEKLGAKLTDNCWYDFQPHRARDGMMWLDEVDVVLFAPGKKPIQVNFEEAVAAAGIPLVILSGWGRKDDHQDMATLRTEFLYRKSGCTVLHGPFAPYRLYRTIDGAYLKHLTQVDTGGRRMVVEAG